MRKNTKRRNKLTIDKYQYGSYVILNQQQGEPATAKANQGKNALSGLSTGAQLGSAAGPWGAAIGAVVGGVGGLIAGGAQNRKRKAEQLELDSETLGGYNLQYDQMVDNINENPYGTYENGGEVLPTTALINIEKGELQVDPETGKIIREFTGINPETGGLYEPHADKGKDSKNNMVSAEEGSFIITKEKAKEYKDALANNDKLAQNTIMQNIKNKKRQNTIKFQSGGRVLSKPLAAGVVPIGTINNGVSTLPQVNLATQPVVNNTNPQANNFTFDWKDAVSALPAVSNFVQGFSSPNYMQNSNSPANPFMNRILGNMPREINYSPLFNRIYRDRNNAYNLIDQTTNSSAVARANKLNVMANTQRGIQDTFFQGEDMNNRIRMQRAGIFDSLGQQEQSRFDSDRRYNYNVDLTNSQMAEGRRQQMNRGITKLGELFENRNTNRQLMDRDMMLASILPEIFYGAAPYYERWGIGNRRGGGYGNR